MIILRFIASLAIFISCIPVIILGLFVIPILLLTSWDGTTTPWGNARWGKGETNPAWMKTGYWNNFVWLALRNPDNNYDTTTLAINKKPYTWQGNLVIGDQIAPGFYAIAMGWAWEYYWIYKYNFLGARCIRIRFGWKINGATTPTVPFVFAINPWANYGGV
jgi:hypothetical protein